ncbi:nitroreductase [Rhodococcus sp. SC4]|nr:nitroreductase [Rhodococcus sp. SC4]
MLFQDEHIRKYEETDGAVGHEWMEGVHALVLTTKGRRTGHERKFAVIYRQVGEDFVTVASRGGADTHPNWYLNLVVNSTVRVQVGAEKFIAKARIADGPEREQLWLLMVETFPTFAEYQQATARVLPVVVLERQSPAV